MGIIARIAGLERRAVTGDALEKYLIRGAANGGPLSDVHVDQDTALSSTALFQALRILSGSVGMVPLGIYQRTGAGRNLMRDHPTHLTLQQPNPEITAIELRQMVTSFAASAGNGYAQIVFDRRGHPAELWPIPPHRIRPDRAPTGALRYHVSTADGATTYLPAEEVFHLRGFMRGGLLGVDVIEKMQEAVGLAIATEKFAGAFFGNGSFLSGFLKFPARLGKEAKDNVRKSLDNRHGGVTRAHRIGFLEDGMEWVQSGADPGESQLLEQRRLSVEEASRILNVPPHLLHNLDRATFNNIEELGISFVVYSLGEWFARWEQTIGQRLLLPSERSLGLYAKHNPNALLRGNHKARGQFYKTLHQLGALSADDIRELEDMNPLPDGVGARYFVRRDTIPLDSIDELVDSLGAAGRAPQRSEHRDIVPIAEARAAKERRAVDKRIRMRSEFRPILREAAASVVRKEVVAVRAALRKAFGGREAARLSSLLDEIYEQHGEYVAERFAAALQTYGRRVAPEAAGDVDARVPDDLDEFMGRYAQTLGRRWSGSSTGQLRQLIRDTDPDELEAAIEQRMAEWEERRPDKAAEREAVEAGEAVTAYVYAAAAISALVWRANQDACPLCQSMDGRRIGIRDYFVTEGGVVDAADDETAPLISRQNVRHPPLHGGCVCYLLPGF